MAGTVAVWAAMASGVRPHLWAAAQGQGWMVTGAYRFLDQGQLGEL